MKVDWMLEELQPGYNYTVLYSGPGTDEFEPIADYDRPMSFIGNQCFYEHIHEDPGLGAHLYQLNIHTPDGELMHSEMEIIALLDEVILFPNPAKDLLIVSLANPFQAGDQLHLLNAKAQLLRKVSVRTGQRQLNVDVADLPLGTYFVRLRRGLGSWEILPFVKE